MATYLNRHHIAFLALFVALSGTAYAAGLPRGSVGAPQLKKNAVTSAKVHDETITGRDVRDGTIGSADVLDGSLTARDLADGSVSSTEIGDSAVTSRDVLDGSLTARDLADGAVTAAELGVPLMVKLRVRPGDGSNVSLPSNQPLTPIAWEEEVIDTGDLWDPAEPGLITIPRDGIWQIQGQVAFGTSGNGFRHVAVLSPPDGAEANPAQGNAILGNTIATPNADVSTVVPVGTVVRLERGQTLSLTVSQNSRNELSLEPAPHSTTLSLTYLGAAPS